MNFDDENFRKYMKEKQYRMNEKDEWIASCYGNKLLYNEIVELRLIALKQILIKYNVISKDQAEKLISKKKIDISNAQDIIDSLKKNS